MSDVFHLNLTKAQLKGATLAIVPGDPARSERIAKKLDNPEFLASTREFTSWLGYLNGQPVVVCSTGNGGPFSLMQLKVIQEVITLIIFTLFTTVFFKGDALHWNHLAAFVCLIAAVYFVFMK